MRSFSDPALFRVIDMLVASANPAAAASKAQWTQAGAHWCRDRHSYSGILYSYTTEVCTITHSGAKSWRLLSVKEHWRTGNGDRTRPSADPDRHVRWARLVSGNRKDAFAWFRARQTEIEKHWENVPARSA